MDDTVRAYIGQETGEGFPEEWDLERLWGAFAQLYPVRVTIEGLEEAAGDRANLTAEDLVEAVTRDIHDRYEDREAELGAEALRDLERLVVLNVLDRKWREHLYEMDYLRDGIGLRWTLGREPIVEYEREGFDMYGAMTDAIKEESVGYVFNLDASGGPGPSNAATGSRTCTSRPPPWTRRRVWSRAASPRRTPTRPRPPPRQPPRRPPRRHAAAHAPAGPRRAAAASGEGAGAGSDGRG